VAEELGLQQGVRKSRAIDRDEGVTAAAAAFVDQAGHDLLADAAFTGDEDLRIGAGRMMNLFFNVPNGGAGTNQQQRVPDHDEASKTKAPTSAEVGAVNDIKRILWNSFT
jgi:hypothetical protein